MKFRKKPVVIEAVQWLGDRFNTAAPDWIGKALVKKTASIGSIFRFGDDVQIFTLEGMMLAKPGDYIIRGIKGELYPCKPDIFEATYEPVED